MFSSTELGGIFSLIDGDMVFRNSSSGAVVDCLIGSFFFLVIGDRFVNTVNVGLFTELTD